jgi:hypothetical protein
MVVAPEMPADHSAGGNHGMLTRRSSGPEPWKTHKTTSMQQAKPSLSQDLNNIGNPLFSHALPLIVSPTPRP